MLLSVLLSMLSLGALLTFQRIGASSTVISVDPQVSAIAPSQSFSVSVKVTNVSELYAWQFNLTFNPAVLNVVNVTEGPFLSQVGATYWGFTEDDIHNADGWVFVACSFFPIPEHGATGSGVLATVILTVKAEGLSNLHFSGMSETSPETSLATYDHEAMVPKTIDFSAVDGVFAYPLWRDLAVTNIVASPTSVLAGEPVSVNVTVTNLGNFTETFNATAYYDSTAIGTRTGLTLEADADRVLTFTWDTTGVALGNYPIKAEVRMAQVDNNSTNNVLTNGTVTIELAHDVAVTGVTVSPSSVASGGKVSVNVTVTNKGSATETFNVTLSYGSTVIETEPVTGLLPGDSKTLDFVWETKDVAVGDYTLTANAGPVSGEIKTSDNTYSGVVVTVTAAPMLPLELWIGMIVVIIVVVGGGAFLFMRRRSKKA